MMMNIITHNKANNCKLPIKTHERPFKADLERHSYVLKKDTFCEPGKSSLVLLKFVN